MRKAILFDFVNERSIVAAGFEMGHFLLSRVIQSMLTILVISMVVFVMARATGDPVTLLACPRSC